MGRGDAHQYRRDRGARAAHRRGDARGKAVRARGRRAHVALFSVGRGEHGRGDAAQVAHRLCLARTQPRRHERLAREEAACRCAGGRERDGAEHPARPRAELFASGIGHRRAPRVAAQPRREHGGGRRPPHRRRQSSRYCHGRRRVHLGQRHG